MALDKSKFQKPAAPIGKGPAPAAAGGRARSRWAGMRSSTPKDPFPEPGLYRFRVTAIERGFNPGKQRESIKSHLQILDADERGAAAHEIGSSVIMVNFMTSAGMAEFQTFVTACAGCVDDEEYVQVTDDNGTFIDALLGQGSYGASLDGRLVDCEVKRGKQAEDGTFYPRFSWSVVEDSETDQVPSVRAQLAAN